MLNSEPKASFWHDPRKRGWLFQGLALVLVVSFVTFLWINTQSNLQQQGTASGFGFLAQEAGFQISEPAISYWADDSYARALLVGFLNTLKVAVIGNILAIILGILIGICRLSSNWLVSRLSFSYIEVIRNIPLLLQLFFWYAILIEIFPSVHSAWEPIPHVFLSQRGIVFPIPDENAVWSWVRFSFLGSLFISYLSYQWFEKKRLRDGYVEGKSRRVWPLMIAIVLGFPLATWLLGGAPVEMSWPALGRFNFDGGHTISPEFAALVIGLVVYTSAFNAEIVRAGIQSVPKGQWEASEALGLTRAQTLRKVILPQSQRVIIPPMTSQILNLIKNSSLAVGIGYPDFVSVANTTMNQTGQAIEAVFLIMVVYLFFSLGTSLFMNFYNKKTQFIIRGSH